MKKFKILTLCVIVGALASCILIAVGINLESNLMFYFGLGTGLATGMLVAIILLYIGDNYEEIYKNTSFKNRKRRK